MLGRFSGQANARALLAPRRLDLLTARDCLAENDLRKNWEKYREEFLKEVLAS